MRTVDGRYEVIRKLGEGGMGRVYLARNRKDKGREVALKFISQQVMERGGAEGFKQEFELLTRLKHPNLVEVYDFGHDRDECYFTMEYVVGEDLFAYAQINPPQRLLGAVVGVLRALEYIHSRGLIHYDVKPENIRVGEGGKVVKLMDLGLAAEGGMRLAGKVKGTLAYIAPELAKGGEIDKRADLYSLGVTLYYVLTRRLPFDGQTPIEVARNRIGNESPFMPAGFPEPWKEIVTRLLSLEPHQRYSSANEVIRAINQLSGEDFPLETKETRASYILSGRFVGRDREFRRLTKAMERRSSGNGGDEPTVFLLKGERGIGKKRLLRELKYKAQLDGVGFFSGSCYQEGGDPYQSFVEILQQIIGTLDRGDPLLAQYSPELVKLGSSLIEAEPSPELEPNQEKLRLQDAVTSFLCGVSSSKPLLLSLMDIQWADEVSMELLSYLGRNSRGKRVLICANLQEEEGIPAPLVEMEKEKYCQILFLEKLSNSEVRELIGSMLGTPQIPPELEERVIHWSGGTPLLVEEAMKSLTEEGVLYRQEGQWRCDSGRLADFEVPTSVHTVLEKRLERLTFRELKPLQALSVINHPIDLDLLSRLLSLSPEELASAMKSLEGRKLVRRSWKELISEYEISHQITSNLIYSHLSPEERRSLHRKVGVVLEKRGKGVEELAYHSQRGGGGVKAATYCRRAGLKAKKLYSNQLSISYFQSALQNLREGTSKVRANILSELGEVLTHTGESEKAIAIYEQLLRDFGTVINKRQKAKICSKLATAWENRSEYDNSLQALKDGMELLGRGAKGRLLAELMAKMATVEQRKGNFDSCQRFCDEGLKALGRGRACREGGLLYNVLGNANFYLGKNKRAKEFYQRSLQIRERIGDQRSVSSSLNNLGNVYFQQGDYVKAIDFHTRSMEISERIGNIMGVSGSYVNLGNIFQAKGEPSKALSYFQKSMKISQRVGDKNGLASCLNNSGGIYVDKGDYGEAAKLFQRSQKIARQIGNRLGEAMGYTNLGITFYHRGRYYQALMLYRKGLRKSRQLWNIQLEAITLINLAELYLTLGEVGKASRHVKEAIALAQKMGEKFILGDAYCTQGKIAAEKGKLEEAEDTLRKAMEISTQLGNEIIRGITFVGLGNLCLQKGNFEEALGYCEEALSIAERLGAKELLAFSFLLRGMVEAQRSWGSRTRALKFLERGVNLAQTVENPEIQWMGNYEMGKLYQEEKLLHEALRHYKECISIFKSCCSQINEEKLKWSYLEEKWRGEVFEAIKGLKEISQ